MPQMLRAAVLLLASAVLPACSAVDALNATVSTDGVTEQRDLAFADFPRGKMNVWRPADDRKGLPLVVFVYGGSWKDGSKDDYKFVGAPLARKGVVVAMPDYRLVPEVRFPTFLEDNARAVAYARDHAAEWGADPHRIFLVGHSAGAYDVVMLALDPHYLAAAGVDRATIAGVIGIATPADFLPLDDPATIAAFGQAPDLAATQPISFADGHNPPLLLLHGQSDDTVYLRNSTALAARVKAAGGDVTLKTYPDTGHIGIVIAFAPVFQSKAPVLADVMDFIDRHPAVPSPGL